MVDGVFRSDLNKLKSLNLKLGNIREIFSNLQNCALPWSGQLEGRVVSGQPETI